MQFYRDPDLFRLEDSQISNEIHLDCQRISREILKLVRGSKSQRSLSYELGFSFNQVAKWESGTTLVKWNDFLRLCDCLKVPVRNSLRVSFVNIELNSSDKEILRAIVKKVDSSTSQHKSPAILRKFLSDNEDSSPDFFEVLRLLSTKPALLLGWLSLFVDCQKILTLQSYYRQFIQAVNLVFDDPIVVYVNAALNVVHYRNLKHHDEIVLSEHAACSIEQLRASLEVLVQSGLVFFDGVKYHPSPFDFSFSGLHHDKLRSLTRFTTCLAAERYPSARLSLETSKNYNASQSSVRVAALSRESARKVSDLVIQFHNQMDEIIKKDTEPKNNVQVILVHSFSSNINPPNQSQEDSSAIKL